jgi:hypothetical protein
VVNGSLLLFGQIVPEAAPLLLFYGALDYTIGIGEELDKKYEPINTHINEYIRR